ncbi:MAG TPA: lipid-A-disaccharide synthase, partial [Chryseobacterium sp.]|nr:lipid-A-disaccharide synthase [Chryseobacterium sp.]
ELIQNDLNTENLVKELNAILVGETRQKMLDDFGFLRQKLGGRGASDHAADIIING